METRLSKEYFERERMFAEIIAERNRMVEVLMQKVQLLETKLTACSQAMEAEDAKRRIETIDN